MVRRRGWAAGLLLWAACGDPVVSEVGETYSASGSADTTLVTTEPTSLDTTADTTAGEATAVDTSGSTRALTDEGLDTSNDGGSGSTSGASSATGSTGDSSGTAGATISTASASGEESASGTGSGSGTESGSTAADTSGLGSSSTEDAGAGTTTGAGDPDGCGLVTSAGSDLETGADTGPVGPCGNGQPDPGEDCDDGNQIGGDGCEADCTSSDDVEPIWTLELGGPDGYVDLGTGVAFDCAGNLILGAYTEPDVIWIRKYDASYVEQWTVTYPGLPGSQGTVVAVATDADGNIGFVGDVGEDASAESTMFFGMLDPDGSEIWTTELVEPGVLHSFAGDVAFDADGNLLLTGAVVQPPSIYEDLWVAKYSPEGVQQWTDTYIGPGAAPDVGFAIRTDASSNVLVAGVASASPSDAEIIARTYDAGGLEQWTDTVAGAAGSIDHGRGVAATEDGDVVVAGLIREAPMDGDAWLRRYQADGTAIWTQTYEGTAASTGDGILDVAVAPDDTIVVAGGVADTDGPSAWVARTSADGDVIWERRRIDPSAWWSVAIAPDGRIAVAGAIAYPPPFDWEARFAVYPP